MDTVIAILGVLPGGTGVVGLFGLLIVMLATGMLATRRELNDKDKQIEIWRKAYEVKDDQTDKLSVIGETTVKILTSIEQLARDKGDDS